MLNKNNDNFSSIFQFMFNEKRGKYLLKSVSITVYVFINTSSLFLKIELKF